jgi:glutaredoxin
MATVNFKLPSSKDYIVYTKSNCKYCSNVKELLKDYKPEPFYINCDTVLSNKKEDFLDFIKRIAGVEHRTFPIVFYNGKIVGGFTETKVFYEKNNAFTDLDDDF